jgi:hypothetical protein
MEPLDMTTRTYCEPADISTRIDLSSLPKVNLDHLTRAVTRRIEGYCDRVFTRMPATSTPLTYETRTFLGSGQTILTIDDLLDASAITIKGDAATLTDILFMPYGKLPTTWLEWKSGAAWGKNDEIAISAGWGFSDTLPWDIWDACVGLCVRALERAKTGYQDASAIPDVGQLVYAKAIPVDIRAVLDHYRRLPI